MIRHAGQLAISIVPIAIFASWMIGLFEIVLNGVFLGNGSTDAALGLAMATGIYSIWGVLIGGLLVAVASFAARFAKLNQMGSELTVACVEKITGANGTLKSTIAWIVVFATTTPALTAALRPQLALVSEVPWDVATTLVTYANLGVLAVIYRAAVWKNPLFAGNRLILSTVAGLIVAWIAIGPSYFLTPFGSKTLVLLTFGVWSVIALIAWTDLLRVESKVAAVAITTLAASAFVATFFIYEAKTPYHHWLSQESRFFHPARDLVAGSFDGDFDGFAGRFGGGDCDDNNADINPEALEIPVNGLDDNCFGGDLSPGPLPPAAGTPQLVDAPPNLLLITIDTLRADHVGKTVRGKSLTPNIDALAKDAFIFENAYSVSTHTIESIPAMMSGTYPADWHQGTLHFGIEPTIAEVLRNLGFDTVAALAVPSLYHEMVRGFRLVDNEVGFATDSKISTTSNQTTTKALSVFGEREVARPFFFWAHYFDPHGFYVARDEFVEWLGEGEAAQNYQHEIAATDAAVGALLAGLRAQGGLDNTVVILTSDHGEALGSEFTGHMYEATQDVIRVPLIMHVPGKSGGRISHPISLIDLFPTIMDLFGVTGTKPRLGRSLRPLLEGGSLESAPIFLESNHDGKALFWVVVDREWKLVFDRQRQTTALYNIEDDPDETHNLAGSHPEVFSRLFQELGAWRDRTYNIKNLEMKGERWEERKPRLPDVMRGLHDPL